MRPLLTTFLVLLLLAPSWAAPVRSLVLAQWTDLHSGHPETRAADLASAFREGLALRPDGLVMTGDNVDNKCSSDEFGRRTEAFLRTYAPSLLAARKPILFSVGNNDFGANYQTDPGNMEPVLAAYRKHFGRAFYLDDLGNGVSPRPVGGITWVSVNSLIFSPLNQYEGRGTQARRTLEWLQRQLAAQPAGRPVAILSHVPPTWDLYGHNPAWHPEDLGRLQDLLEERNAPVVILGGHFHRNEAHAFSLPGGRAVPVLNAGALSGKYGNQPNWRSYSWTQDASGAPRSISWRVRYADRPAWNRLWRVERPFEARTWSNFVTRLASDRAFYLRYMEDFWAHNDTWRADAAKADNRQGVLDEFFVRPDLGRDAGPEPEALVPRTFAATR